MTAEECDSKLKEIRDSLSKISAEVLELLSRGDVPQEYVPVFSMVNEGVLSTCDIIDYPLSLQKGEEDESK